MRTNTSPSVRSSFCVKKHSDKAIIPIPIVIIVFFIYCRVLFLRLIIHSQFAPTRSSHSLTRSVFAIKQRQTLLKQMTECELMYYSPRTNNTPITFQKPLSQQESYCFITTPLLPQKSQRTLRPRLRSTRSSACI